MWIQGLLSRPPASSSSTRYRPDSLSRPATAQPADPAPVTMKSKVSSALVAILYPQRCAATIAKPAGIWKAGLPVLHGYLGLCRLSLGPVANVTRHCERSGAPLGHPAGCPAAKQSRHSAQ